MGGKAAQGAMQLQVGELASLHLDGQYRTAGFGAITSDSRKYELQDMQSFLLRTELELGMLPVSYTHLDVYKRQLLLYS